MREPFETLLGGLKDHVFLADHLRSTVPDWAAIDRVFERLSDGEQVLLNIALALYNGDGTARIADITHLDDANRFRVVNALYLAYG